MTLAACRARACRVAANARAARCAVACGIATDACAASCAGAVRVAADARATGCAGASRITANAGAAGGGDVDVNAAGAGGAETGDVTRSALATDTLRDVTANGSIAWRCRVTRRWRIGLAFVAMPVDVDLLLLFGAVDPFANRVIRRPLRQVGIRSVGKCGR